MGSGQRRSSWWMYCSLARGQHNSIKLKGKAFKTNGLLLPMLKPFQNPFREVSAELVSSALAFDVGTVSCTDGFFMNEKCTLQVNISKMTLFSGMIHAWRYESGEPRRGPPKTEDAKFVLRTN